MFWELVRLTEGVNLGNYMYMKLEWNCSSALYMNTLLFPALPLGILPERRRGMGRLEITFEDGVDVDGHGRD
jgi:hypothetical protein